MKACPFCASAATMEICDTFDIGHTACMRCRKCGANGPEVYSEVSADYAIMKAREAWNLRKGPK